MNDIPAPVQTVLDLFATSLAELRFADLDANTLARVAADVRASADVVASAQAALDAARATHMDRQEALLQHAHRALAYARVYAESDESLAAQLDAIVLPRLARRARGEAESLVLSTEPQAAPPRRGRPRKVTLAAPSLEHVSLVAIEP